MLDQLTGVRIEIDHSRLVRPERTVEAVTDDPLPSIASTPTSRLNESSSDHARVVATFPQL